MFYKQWIMTRAIPEVSKRYSKETIVLCEWTILTYREYKILMDKEIYAVHQTEPEKRSRTDHVDPTLFLLLLKRND